MVLRLPSERIAQIHRTASKLVPSAALKLESLVMEPMMDSAAEERHSKHLERIILGCKAYPSSTSPTMSAIVCDLVKKNANKTTTEDPKL